MRQPSPPSSSWAVPPLSPSSHLTSGNCCLKPATSRPSSVGVVEVEQFPQREQDGRAESALFQAQTKEKLFELGSILPKSLSRLAPLVRTAAH